jgi:hypothetical protein
MPIPLGVLAVAGAGVAPVPAGNAYEWLETQVLGTAVASVTFSNLDTNYSSTYQHLQFRIASKSSASGASNSRLRFQVNGDTGTNYTWHGLYGAGSNVASEAITNSNYAYAGRQPGTGRTEFGITVMDVLDPFETSKNTTFRSLSGTGAEIVLWSNVWRSTNALSSIVFSDNEGGNLIIGTRISIYGLRSS